jgi:hypothetical protein
VKAPLRRGFFVPSLRLSDRPRRWVLLPRCNNQQSCPHRGNILWVQMSRLSNAMSVRQHRGGWEARWRDAAGRQRSKRFAFEEAAVAFDAALAEVSPAARRPDSAKFHRRGGVYSYEPREGVRWRFVYRRSDATQTSKRASRGSAARAMPAGAPSSKSNEERCATPRRPSGLTGSAGSPSDDRNSKPVPGPGMRSMAASASSPRSVSSHSVGCRSNASVNSWSISPTPSKPDISPPRP